MGHLSHLLKSHWPEQVAWWWVGMESSDRKGGCIIGNKSVVHSWIDVYTFATLVFYAVYLGIYMYQPQNCIYKVDSQDSKELM